MLSNGKFDFSLQLLVVSFPLVCADGFGGAQPCTAEFFSPEDVTILVASIDPASAPPITTSLGEDTCRLSNTEGRQRPVKPNPSVCHRTIGSMSFKVN